MYPAAPRAAICLYDHIQDLFCKRDDDPAGQRQKSVGTGTGIVRLHRQSHLHDAKPQQDQPDGSDQAEDKRGQIVHRGNRIACRKAGGCTNRAG